VAAVGGVQAPGLHVWLGAACDADYLTDALGDGGGIGLHAGDAHCLQDFATLIALGVLLAVAALVSLALPGVVATEALTMLFGVLLFVAPWVLTYIDHAAASWTSWVVGAIAVVLAGSAMPASNRAHRQAIQH